VGINRKGGKKRKNYNLYTTCSNLFYWREFFEVMTIITVNHKQPNIPIEIILNVSIWRFFPIVSMASENAEWLVTLENH